MPFFRSKSYSNYLTRHSIYKSKKFFAPLQVRTHKYVALLKQKKFRKKGIIMGLLWRTEKHYRGKKRKSYIRSCPLFSAGGIFLRDPDHAYDPDGQAKADPGSSRVCGRRDQPVCLCFLSL